MTNHSYTIFDGQQWNSRRGLGRFARQLRRHLEAAGWHDRPVEFPRWSSSAGRILISEVIEPYRHRQVKPEVAFYPHNVLPAWTSTEASVRVLVLHDVLFLSPENQGLGNRYRRSKLSHSLNKADVIVTVSEASRVAIQSLLTRQIEVLVIPNSLAESFAHIAVVQEKPAAKPVTILHFGGYVDSKNTFALMQAVALLVKDGIDVRLDLAAMARHAELVEQWRAMAELPQGSLRLLPVLNDEELIEAYQRSTFHVMPSKGEGFGIPLIEAARAGVLNVLTPLDVFREIMGPAAIYAEGFDGEAIAAVLRRAMALPQQSFLAQAFERTEAYVFESIHEAYAMPALEQISELASSLRASGGRG